MNCTLDFGTNDLYCIKSLVEAIAISSLDVSELSSTFCLLHINFTFSAEISKGETISNSSIAFCTIFNPFSKIRLVLKLKST